MIKKIEGERPAFVLSTEKTSYAFRIMPSGHPEHLHYGRKINIAAPEHITALTEKRAFEPGCSIRYYDKEGVTILEDICLEASTAGHGDIREPFAEIVFPDGSSCADFLYKDSFVSNTKEDFATLPGSYFENGGEEHLTVVFEDKLHSAELELHYYVYPECDVICRSSKLINRGEGPLRIERLMSMQLDLPDSGYEISSFHGAWAREMNRNRIRLDAGKFVSESRVGCSSNRANTFFMLHSPSTDEFCGDCYGFNLIYSGNHYEAAEVNAYGKTRIVSGIDPQGFSFTLGKDESFEAPEAIMSYSDRGFGGQSENMHRFIREHIVRGEWKGKVRPVLLNSWEASYFNISESSLLSLAKTGRELGIELFVMDDGWFGERSDDKRSLGDWDPDKKKLPHGLSGLCEKINGLGMQFGVWVEPEMVNVDSRLYEAHPDWVLGVPGNPHSEGRNQRLLDFANPAVTEYMTEKMTEVFSSADIAYVKWDMNRIYSDVYSPYLPADRQCETAHRCICGVYKMLDTLTKRFPHILFEGCASGGNRFDPGMLCYFPQIWGSDNTDPVCRADIQNNYSFGYPMDTVGAHVSSSPNHQTLRRTSLSTRFNIAAFGVLGYELDLNDLSKEEREEIKEQIDIYKSWRDVFQQGEFHRVRSDNICEWICVSRDKKRAVGMLMQKLVVPNMQTERFIARGLDGDMLYRFRNIPKNVDIKLFGGLINMVSPIHVRQDSAVHNIIAKVVKLQGESEDVMAYGDTLMNAGVKLNQAFSGTGFDKNVRIFPDFATRMYFIEAVE